MVCLALKFFRKPCHSGGVLFCALFSVSDKPEDYWSSCSTDWGCWFAWASIAWADCTSTFIFV